MRTYLGVVGLALASSAAPGAAGQSAAPQTQVIVADTAQKGVLVADEKDRAPDVSIRRLAFLEGRGVELGVSIRDLDPDRMAETSGAVVEDVQPGSAAEKAGLQKGDVITNFDGERVRGARHLSRMVTETPEGRTVPVAVLRGGETMTLSVTPESAGAPGPRAEFAPPMHFKIRPGVPGFTFDDRHVFETPLPGWEGDGFELFTPPGKARLGIRVQDLTPQLAEYFGAGSGVLVSNVEPDSPAASAGLKAGDVITAVNGTEVKDTSALVSEIGKAEDGAALSIEYVRDRKPATATATLPEREKKRARQIVRPV